MTETELSKRIRDHAKMFYDGGTMRETKFLLEEAAANIETAWEVVHSLEAQVAGQQKKGNSQP